MDKLKIIVLAATGVLTALNGLFMIIEPLTWFDTVPGVSRTGLPNSHLIRDVGIAYFAIGVGLIWVIKSVTHRFAVCVAATAWLGGHAIFHFWELMAGVCTFDQFVTDFPGVFIPALITAWLALVVRHDAKEA